MVHGFTKTVVLARVESSHGEVRTDTVGGWCERLPEVGQQFLLVGPPLERPDGFRIVRTTAVEKIMHCSEKTGGVQVITFSTRNSIYTLEVLDV